MKADSIERKETNVVLGMRGQVGSALLKILPNALGFSRNEAPFEEPQKILDCLGQTQPTWVFNGVAYNQVDQAEQEENQVKQINAQTPAAVAEWCQKNNATLVHYSTDYVFGMGDQRPWKETDPVSPLSAYARSKEEGERLIRESGCRHLIFRTSWVYNETHTNFLTKILKRATSPEQVELRIVDDQVGAPTYAPHLAEATWNAVRAARDRQPFPTGTYHLCHQGETSWHGFAQAILAEAEHRKIPLRLKSLQPVPSSEFNAPAKRPLNSRLSTAKIEETLQVSLPNWKNGLKTCFERLRWEDFR